MTLEQLQNTHSQLLDRAIRAIGERTYFSAYPEAHDDPAYGSDGRAEGRAAFSQLLAKRFPLDKDVGEEIAGEQVSPYGKELAMRYSDISVERATERAKGVIAPWSGLHFEQRAALCIEILGKLMPRAFEMAEASMHTSGQPFAMAFQAGTSHALERALEAIAYAVREMRSLPASVVWEKPAGKSTSRIEKTFDIVPRGVALAIGCSTFPTWNTYPGVFASLVAGNPVIIKPHPGAILPLAIFVQTVQSVFEEYQLDPNIIQLVVDSVQHPKTKQLAQHPDVRLIDFTGSSAFGDWLEQEARQAVVFTEKSGVNPIVIESTSDFNGMVRNIAISLALYSGQMCTTPQNIYVPVGGIQTPDGLHSAEEFRAGVVAAIEKMTSDSRKAVELLGVVQSQMTRKNLDAASEHGETLLASRHLQHPDMPDARISSPAVVLAQADNEAISREHFGAISFMIEVPDAREGLRRAEEVVSKRGAISWSVYSLSEPFILEAKAAAARAGAHLSLNLTGAILVNQSAAYSDFHVSGRNPAGNASLCDTQFVLPRFSVLQTRRYLA